MKEENRSQISVKPNSGQRQSGKHLSAVPANATADETHATRAAEPTGNPLVDIETTWSSFAKIICCINTYPNGIGLSLHVRDGDHLNAKVGSHRSGSVKEQVFHPYHFNLRVRDTRDYQLPEGKFFVYKKDALANVERHLSTLHRQNVLQSTVVYLGTSVDPFLSFHKRFDQTNGCLQLLEQYKPQLLVVQTRSPMVLAGLPTIKALGQHAVVTIPIETSLERAIQRYTPGLPKISERLMAAQGLRRQGVRVNLSAAPLLPYGDVARDAWDFAELLDRYADVITVGCLASGDEADERQLKELPIAQRLVADQQFHWLRPQAYQALYQALQVVAPEKLRVPVRPRVKSGQLTLFAA